MSPAGRRYVLVGIGMPLAVYLIYTALGFAAAGQASDAGWADHFTASMAALGAMSAALAAGSVADWPERARGTRWGARSKQVRRLGLALALAGPPMIAISVAGALLNDVQLAAGRWLDLLASLWVGVIPFLVLGLLVSRVVHPDTAEVVVLGIAITIAVLGGFFQPITTMPPAMIAIATVLPSYHLASLGWSAVVGLAPTAVDIAALGAYTVALLAMLGWTAGDETRRGHG